MKLGLLTSANDWQAEVDPGKYLLFPARIISTRLWSDMITVADSTKQLIFVELTAPWEERMDEVIENMHAKELVDESRR